MKKKLTAPKPPTASRRTQSSRASTGSTASHWKWIRIKSAFPLPAYVRSALQKLDEAGFVAYVVGGSVRDFLLQRESKDHDIATDATPDQICELFPDAVTVGKAFGVIKVPVEGAPEMLEIATFREDLEYQDHRHPEGVKFSGPIEDAQRRDFTINALFYDPKTARILDSTGGFEDLRHGVIRAIGDPQERFREDALRLLRAVRFSTALSFEIDPSTAVAIADRAKLISHVSGERIRDELSLMLKGPKPAEALESLSRFGLLPLVLSELEQTKGIDQSPSYGHVLISGLGARRAPRDVWGTTLKTLRNLSQQVPDRSFALSWAAALHEVGKPIALVKNEGKNFNAHEIEAGVMVRSIGHRLKMARADVDRIASIVEDMMKFYEVFKMREATLERFVRQENFPELLALHRAHALSSDGNLAYYDFCLQRYELAKASSAASTRLIDGKDLIQLGFKPGPEFSNILRTVEDLALEKKISTKEQALEYVVSRFVK